MKDYSEALKAFISDPKNQEMIQELLYHHTLFVNETRDIREKQAKDMGLTYQEYMVFIETEHKRLAQEIF